MTGCPNPLLARTALACAISTLFLASAFAQENSNTPSPAPQILPQVDVTEQAEPGTSTTISGDELDRANNMKDVVRNQPLVSAPGTAAGTTRNRSSFDRSGTTGYNIRGIEGNRVGMDVDGVEMPDATTRPYVSRAGVNTFGVGRDFIDPEMFSTVNILSGTTSAKRSAGGIGGAVSFKTKSADDYLRGDKTSYFGAKLGYDSADRSWNESVTAAGKSGNLDGLISYSRRDGHATRNNSDIVDSMANDWNSDALLLKGGLRIDARNRLELSADLYRRKNDTFFNGWDTNSTTITENSQQHSDTSRNTLQLTHQWTPNYAWIDQADTRLYFQSTDTEDTTDTTTLSTSAKVRNVSENKTRTWGVSSVASKRLDRHNVSYGINASTQDVDRPWNVSGYMKPQPDTTTVRAGVFVQDDISFDLGGHRLMVIPALRGDYVKIKTRDLDNFVSGVLTIADVEKMYGSRSNTIWSPSLGLSYDLTPTMLAYAQYKRSGRAPSAGEIFGSWNLASNYLTGNQYALVGNQNLKEETSDAFEVGVKGKPTPGVTLNSSLFYTKYNNFIAYTRYTRALYPSLFTNVPAHIGTIYQAENRDDAKIYGLELSARLEHGQWNPLAQGFYSTWAMGLSRGTSKSHYDGDKDVPLDSVLPRKAIIGAGYDAPQKAWGLNLTGTFVAGKQAVATNRDAYTNAGTALTDSTTALFRVPGYAVFDLISYWQINKNTRLDLGIYNLGDKRYWDYSSARNLQPSVARDRRDMELLTESGRTAAASLNLAF
ncbi:TonB-dependent hemoglobin/transferrin/lactoferrin family receptor [Duganella sp. FT80W]|uniref:TonB-dependent hemoglobin/transferrin/lactoferrin family receptor n=1 Tax=Duganella guangzhouensis TaxID=2666084 RepID=A0A6I2L4A0_9BURK|nr:TonB-dependent hemoglobin/transferrin/lactoferrin family receptor [Duganella guangzhouensis]MRW91426.1 TonB-dependent hemoglobin/transferrin/lactoferrin family receptor [Duganella guangzhouensis]